MFLELEGLVKFIRPFMLLVSKAKAAKMVRVLDLFLDMEVSTGTEVLQCVILLMIKNVLTDRWLNFLKQKLHA